MRAVAIPSTLEVPGRKRQHIKKKIIEEDKIHNIVISSEDEPVPVKKEPKDSEAIYNKITVNIKLEKEEIVVISSDENSNKLDLDTQESENSSEENSSDESSIEITEDSNEESSDEIKKKGEESSDHDEKEEYYFEHKEIKQFIKYLQRPPYIKARKDALQHAYQVWHVWGDLSKKRKMKELFSLDKLNDWLHEFLKDHAPGTARSYLSSVGMFVGHLVRQGILKKGVGKALRFKEDIKLLSKQIRNKVQTRRTRLDVEEISLTTAPPKLMIAMYGQSKANTLYVSIISGQFQLYTCSTGHVGES